MRLQSSLLIISPLLLTACASEQELTLHFEAELAGRPFACGSSYEGVGADGQTVWPTDLRAFVHQLELLDADGVAHPFLLEPNGSTQSAEVALLDFEDGTANCEGGTPSTHTVLTGTAPTGAFVGLRFVLGVPEPLNHANPDLAEEPLAAAGQASGLLWSWLSGYRFLRFDVATSDKKDPDFGVHVGSSACTQEEAGPRCTYTNRAVIELTGFDPTRDAVVLDASAILAAVELGSHALGHGCHGALSSEACMATYPTLGLDAGFDEAGVPLAPAHTPQSVFRVRAR